MSKTREWEAATTRMLGRRDQFIAILRDAFVDRPEAVVPLLAAIDKMAISDDPEESILGMFAIIGLSEIAMVAGNLVANRIEEGDDGSL